MKATLVVTKLNKLIEKYGNNIEIALKEKSMLYSFKIKDKVLESGWIEIESDFN